MSKKQSSKLEQELQQKMKDIKNKTISPTQALMTTVKGKRKTEEEESEKKTNSNNLSDLFEKPPTIEDTHTRRTFLIRNDLLERLDDKSNKPKNFRKTKFINYILEKGLDELEGIN